LFNYLSRYRDANFNRVLAPEGEILSFASPSHMDVVNVENAGAFFHKRKYPKLGRPGCRLLPAFRRFCQGLPKGTSVSLWQSAASLSRPFGLFPTLTPVLGAAYGNLS
jgi:hypothetical protein